MMFGYICCSGPAIIITFALRFIKGSLKTAEVWARCDDVTGATLARAKKASRHAVTPPPASVPIIGWSDLASLEGVAGYITLCGRAISSGVVWGLRGGRNSGIYGEHVRKWYTEYLFFIYVFYSWSKSMSQVGEHGSLIDHHGEVIASFDVGAKPRMCHRQQ